MGDKMRDAFETWAEKQGMTMMRDGESYYHHVTHNAWISWQASRAITEHAATVESKELWTNHRHYFHQIPPGIVEADIYRLIEIIGITCPVAQHVFKKSAAAGQRGHKDLRLDWENILDSAKRKLEMLDEDDWSAAILAESERGATTDVILDEVTIIPSDFGRIPGEHELISVGCPDSGGRRVIAWQDPILDGHEVNTEFDSEERTKNIASSHGDGEHCDEAHPVPDPKVQGETWIMNTGENPNLPENTRIEAELRNGAIYPPIEGISAWNWSLDGGNWDIIRYRIL